MKNYDGMPDGTYFDGPDGLERVERENGYWVALEPNTRAGRNAKFIGIWTDPDGKVYVDKSRWVFHAYPAFVLARKHNQQAIWDCAEGRAIYV